MSIEIESLRLPDSAFWESDSRDPGLDPLPNQYETELFGILIDGPREVSIENKSTLPLFAYYMGSYKQVVTRDFPHAASMVAVDPDRNQIYVAPLAGKSDEPPPPRESVPDSEIPEGYVTTFSEKDLRKAIELPWKSGRIISQVILLDLYSNRIETKLVQGSGAFHDVEKEKFLAAERAQKDPSAPFPPMPSSILSTVWSGEIPSMEPGIKLAAPRVFAWDERRSLQMEVAWKLPVLPEEMVKPGHHEYNRLHQLLQPDGKTPFSACISLHLVVFGSEEKGPEMYTLRLPVSKLVQDEGKTFGGGKCQVNLSKLPGFPRKDQTLFIYAFAQQWSSEPVSIGIVAPK